MTHLKRAGELTTRIREGQVLEILFPSREEMLRIQVEQGAYYWSAAVDVVLRKRGLIPRLSCNDGTTVTLVGRHTAADLALGPGPRILEGPLSESVCKALDLNAQYHEAEDILIETSRGHALGRLLYNRYEVRRIPPSRAVSSEPFEFISSDPLWNNKIIRFQSLMPKPGDRTLLYARPNDNSKRHCVGLRRGNTVLLGIPLLDVITQHHAPPVYEDAGYFRGLAISDMDGLETWLTGRCKLTQKNLTKLVTIERWPAGYNAALTVRHDFDRPLKDSDLRELLDFYAATGIKATWFWRLSRIDRQQLRAVLQAGHEVALHTEVGTREAFHNEVVMLTEAAGECPQGYSAHGGIPAVGYLGARQMQWAMDAGMHYGESLGLGLTPLPHFAVLTAGAVPKRVPLMLPPQHCSLDLTTKADGHAKEALIPESKRLLKKGLHCVIMNHPDIHRQELMELLSALPMAKVWKATLGEVTRWARQWQGAHYTDSHGTTKLRFESPLSYSLALQFDGQPHVVPPGSIEFSLENSNPKELNAVLQLRG